MITQFTCSGCGQIWPDNYCPVCHATVDRSALATAVAAPLGKYPAPAVSPSVAGSRPSSAPWPSRPLRTDSSRAEETARFTFTGTAGEYFRLWIVNVALTVLTLGIYAAWAKVRKRQYFWSNTQLGGRAFEYTGNPIAILKGNLILGAGALAYYVAIKVEPLLGYASLAGIWLVYPWLFQKAMRFNSWNTRYRNIRCGFHGSVSESYAINLGLLLLVPLTLGLIWPYAQFRRKRYQIGNLSFGHAHFHFGGSADLFYQTFFKALGLFLAGALVGIVVAAIVGATGPGARVAALGVGFILVYLAAGLVLGIYYPTRVTNYVMGQTSLEGVASFSASLGAREMLGMELVNLLAIVGTLGLATPWAAVRRAQYRWSHIEARLVGPIDSVTAAAAPEPGAFGDVAADQLDIEISI